MAAPPRKRLPLLIGIAALAALYFLGARLGLLLAIEKTNATPIWPPAGIALAGMLILGWRAWPGVWLGAFFANVTAFSQNQAAEPQTIFWVSAAIACGNAFEAILGWILCTRVNGKAGLPTMGVSDEILFGKLSVFQFAAVALIATLASAAIGPAVICLSHIALWKNYLIIWLTWLAGDATGILYTTPLLLALTGLKFAAWPRLRWAEAIAAFATLFLSCWLLFRWLHGGTHAMTLKFIVIAPLVWIALRIGLRATVFALVVLALFVVNNVQRQFGSLVGITEAEVFLVLLAYLWVVAVTSLTLARSIAQYHRTQASLREANAALEATMSAIPAMVFIAHDRDCQRITGNNPAHRFLRVPLDGNLSKSASDGQQARQFEVKIGGKPALPDELAMQKAAATGQSIFGQEQELVFSNGEVRFIYGNAVPLLDDDGVPRGCLAAFLDVTARKHAEAALELASRLPEENPFPVVRLSQGKIVSYMNPAGRRMLKAKDIGIGDEAPPEFIHAATKALAENNGCETEVCADRNVYWVSVVPVTAANYVNLYFVDVTERKQAERRLSGHLAISRILAEAPALSDATPRILQTICETFDWDFGDMWTPDPDAKVLLCLKTWSASSGSRT